MRTWGSGAARQWGRAVWAAALLALAAAPATSAAQSLADRAEVRDGKVRLSFASRPDVCGDGENIHITRSTDDWVGECDHGPARVVLEWREGVLVNARTYVGGRWREAGPEVRDLGVVPAAQAANYLLDLAVRAPSRAGKKLVFPATLADSVEVWPRLVTMARDQNLARDIRKDAIFWLGQAAGDQAVGPLGDLARQGGNDVDVQEHAVFALSQLRDGGGVEALLDIARRHENPKVRKTAMFWLAQSEDPRAVTLFEELLRSR